MLSVPHTSVLLAGFVHRGIQGCGLAIPLHKLELMWAKDEDRSRSTSWRHTQELEARLKDARRTCSALELENQLLRSEGQRKGARISQLEGLVTVLEDDLRSVDASVRRTLGDSASARLLSHEVSDAVDAAVEEAFDDRSVVEVGWATPDWIASLGTCELVAEALVAHVRARRRSAPAERAFLAHLGRLGSRQILAQLLVSADLSERIADLIWSGAMELGGSRGARGDGAVCAGRRSLSASDFSGGGGGLVPAGSPSSPAQSHPAQSHPAQSHPAPSHLAPSCPSSARCASSAPPHHPPPSFSPCGPSSFVPHSPANKSVVAAHHAHYAHHPHHPHDPHHQHPCGAEIPPTCSSPPYGIGPTFDCSPGDHGSGISPSEPSAPWHASPSSDGGCYIWCAACPDPAASRWDPDWILTASRSDPDWILTASRWGLYWILMRS